MIKIEHTEVVGWEAAIRGMRNPMNSWGKGDTGYGCDEYGANCAHCGCYDDTYADCGHSQKFIIGPNDKDLMRRLCKAGTDHRKFMRMITVYVDITAPLYFWKEFSTYKVGTVANSCSTMHKIHAKEFTLDDFSREHLFTEFYPNGMEKETFLKTLGLVIDELNVARSKYLETKDKKYWWQMIQLLPSSYNQKRTVMLNYEVLANMYKSRKNHKLDEWVSLCEWIKTLPYAELITGEFEE